MCFNIPREISIHVPIYDCMYSIVFTNAYMWVLRVDKWVVKCIYCRVLHYLFFTSASCSFRYRLEFILKSLKLLWSFIFKMTFTLTHHRPFPIPRIKSVRVIVILFDPGLRMNIEFLGECDLKQVHVTFKFIISLLICKFQEEGKYIELENSSLWIQTSFYCIILPVG